MLVSDFSKGGVGTQATLAMATFQPLFLYISESIRFIIYQKHFSSVNFGFRLHQGLVPETLNSKISWRSMPPDPPRVFWSMA